MSEDPRKSPDQGGPPGADGRVQARTVKGFRDIFPDQVAARRRMIDVIRTSFERFGFVPLDTPAIEYTDALAGLGEEGTKSLFRMKSPEGEAIALRYDLTVPLARVVAQYPDLPRPFRRYQVAPVWRADKPDPGRFREFLQFDIDSVGTPSLLADAEILIAMDEALRALGLTTFRIRYSSRRLLDALLDHAGVPAERRVHTLRVLDKLDKQGLEAVLAELGAGRVDQSGDKIAGVGLDAGAVGKIRDFLALAGRGGDRSRVIADLAAYFAGVAAADPSLEELTAIDGFLAAAGVPSDRVAVDPSIARGLEYYTGPVFEAILTDLPRYGAIFGGGRYDGLVERFLGVKIPATGASLGVDRLLSAMTELGLAGGEPASAHVLVTVMDQGRILDYLRIAQEIRGADPSLRVEIYLGEAASLKKQMAHADRARIPIAVIAGSNEFDAGTISIKDLREGRRREGDTGTRQEWVKKRPGQQTVARGEMIRTIQSLLELE